MSRLAIRVIEKALASLRVPANLTDNDRWKLDQLLSAAEQLEVSRLYGEIKQGRDFMALPIYYSEEFWEVHVELEGYEVDMWWNKRYYRSHARKLNIQQKRIAEYRAKGYKNPNAYAEPNRLIAFNMREMDAWLGRMVKCYNALTPYAKQFFIPPVFPVSIPAQLERPAGRDLAFWPNSPTAWQEAYIEVLERKLAALRLLFP